MTHISYNGTKEVSYQYNKVGELVKMDDWLGTTTFQLDLLNRLTKVTDHKGNVVEYTYDAVGNQTSVTYPDETTVSKSYDALGQLLTVTDAENQKYTYTYDDAGNVTKLVYPNGWVEDYTYDAEGNLLKTVDTDPFHNNKVSTKYEYSYDAEGNLISEYKRDTTAGNKALTTTYAYDALNRLTSAHEEGVGVNTTRTYQYDTLGNLIREEQDGCVEYKYNGAHLDESTKCGTIPNSIGTSYWEYTYDNRGNLVSRDKYTRTTSGMAWQNEAAYTYDETNRMVSGKNEQGEYSLYTYNGLGMRVGRELIMKDNTHGYTDFHDLTPSVDTGIDKPEVVKESYVIDYTSATFDPLTMDEEGGFSYRYVYGLNTLSVKITSEGTNWWGQHVTTDILKDYYHQDRLGSTTNLTDKFGRVVGRADYNEWGEITYREALTITSSYRRIYPQSSYTGHDWDDVLGMYYAKARFYSAEDKRFVAMDPIKGEIVNPLSLVPYVYCVDNPLRWVDPSGESLLAIILITVGSALIMGTVNAVVDASLQYKQHGSIDFTLTAIKFVEGAVAGGLAASPAPGLAVLVGVPLASGISSIAYDVRTNELGYTDYNIREMMIHATGSAAYSLAVTGAGNYFTSGSVIADGSTRPLLEVERYTYVYNSTIPAYSYKPGIIPSATIRGAIYAGGYSVVTAIAKGAFDYFTCKEDEEESPEPTGSPKSAKHDMLGSMSSKKSSRPIQSQINQKSVPQANQKLVPQTKQMPISNTKQQQTPQMRKTNHNIKLTYTPILR